VKLAAKLAGMSEEEFVALNPSNNGAIAVAKGGTLLVPLDKADAFSSNLQGYDKPLVTWTTVQAKAGESIESLAKRYGVPAHEFRAANGAVKLNKKGRLAVSQSIMVPMRGAGLQVHVASVGGGQPKAAAAPKAVPVANGSNGATASARSYVVKPGDTLFSISQRFNAALADLLHLNNLTPKSVIQPGLKLRLP
jgi:membrane-bound lytic murein transglycosylase D